MNHEDTGKTLLAIGIALCLVGGLIWRFGDRIKGLGRLPGDFIYEGEHFKFYFPLTTLVLLNGLLWLILKIWEKVSK